MIAPRLPGSVTPSTATRNGWSCRSPDELSEIGFGDFRGRASTPCGASVRASCSSLPFATSAAEPAAPQRSRRCATPSSPSSSALIQISCTLRRSAISNSRTAWRPSTCRPPSPLPPATRRRASRSLLAGWPCSVTALDRLCLPDASGIARRSRLLPVCCWPARLALTAGRSRLARFRAGGRLMVSPSHRGRSARWRSADVLTGTDRTDLLGPVPLDRHGCADGGGQGRLHLVAARASWAVHTPRRSRCSPAATHRPPARRRRGAASRSSRRRPSAGRCRESACRCRRGRRARSASAQA